MEKEENTVITQNRLYALDVAKQPLFEVLLKHSQRSTYALENGSCHLISFNASLALSENQKWIAIRHGKGIDVWHIHQHHFVRRFHAGSDHLMGSPVFLQSDTTLLTSTKERQLQLFDIQSGVPSRQTAVFEAKLSSDPALPIAPDRVVVTTGDGMIYCLSVPSLTIVWQTPFPLAKTEPGSVMRSVRVEFLEEQNRLLIWCYGVGLAELDPQDGSVLFHQEMSELRYCGWLDADTVMLETSNGNERNLGYTYNQWEQTLRPRREPPRLLREKVPHGIYAHFGSPIQYLAVKPDEAAVSATSATIHSWQDGRLLMDVGEFSLRLHKPLMNWLPLRTAIDARDTGEYQARLTEFQVAHFHNDFFGVRQVTIFEDACACSNSVLASVGFRRPQDAKPGLYLECYDLETGRCFWKKRLYTGYISSEFRILLSPDGRYLALKWNTIELFDVIRGQGIAEDTPEFGLGISGWHDISFGFDAASAHFVCSDGEVTNIFRLDPFEKVASLPFGQIKQSGSPILLSPDGRLLVSIDRGSLAVCDIADEQLAAVSGLNARASHYGFSPDGRWILFIDGGNLVLCNAETLAVEKEAPLPLVKVDTVHFSPDSQEAWITGLTDYETRHYATLAVTLPDLTMRMRVENQKRDMSYSAGGFIGDGRRFVAKPRVGPIEFRDTENGNLCANFYCIEANPVWFLHDGSGAFWAEGTSVIGVLKKDAANSGDHGKPIFQQEREEFLAEHNKRELVMAGVTGSQAYCQYLTIREQMKLEDALRIGTAHPKALEHKT